MFDNSGYIPSPISPASPLTPMDAYVLAALIQGTITETDPAIAAEIAEQIVLHDISGKEFLDLSRTELRTMSNDNDQVFKELKKLRKTRVSPDMIPSWSTPGLFSLFPEFSSSINHNHQLSSILDRLSGGVDNDDSDSSSSSAMLSAQTPEEFNDEAWDFGDEDIQTPDPPTTVTVAAVPQGDTNLPVALVNPAMENGPPLASTLEQPLPNTHAQTASTSDGHVHSAEEADDASIYGLNEPQLVINSLDSQSVVRLDGENTHFQNDTRSSSPSLSDDEESDATTNLENDSVLPGPGTPITRSSSPALSYVDDEDPDVTAHPGPQNDSILAGPSTRSSSPSLSHVDDEESDATTNFQNDSVLAGPNTRSFSPSLSRVDEEESDSTTNLQNDVDGPSKRSSSPALSRVDEEDSDTTTNFQNDSVLAGPSTRSSSPSLSHVDEEESDATTNLQNDVDGPSNRSSSPSLSHVDEEASDATTDLQNDSVLAGPSTRSSSPSLSHHDEEESDTTIDLQNDSVLAGPSTMSSSPALSYVDDEDSDANIYSQIDSVLDGPILYTPASYVFDDENPDAQIHLGNNIPIPQTTLDPNLLIQVEHDEPPIISTLSTSASTEPLAQDLLDEFELQSSPSCSLDHPQTMVASWDILTEEDKEALEPSRLPADEELAASSLSDTHLDANEALNDEASQSSNFSNEEPDDAIHDEVDSNSPNTGSNDRLDSFTSNETRESIESCQSPLQSLPSSSTLDLEPSHDIDDSNEQCNIDTATFIIPIDIIPLTPPGSPILEGLSQYMIPEAVIEVNQDNISTYVQRDLPITQAGERTLWRPSSEAPRFGLPSSSEDEQSLRSEQEATSPPESPEPNADVTIRLDPPFPHSPSHDQEPTSPLELLQSGLLRLMPNFFALRRETLDRTT